MSARMLTCAWHSLAYSSTFLCLALPCLLFLFLESPCDMVACLSVVRGRVNILIHCGFCVSLTWLCRRLKAVMTSWLVGAFLGQAWGKLDSLAKWCANLRKGGGTLRQGT